jgi:uncharacterized protein (DUF3084 family)
VTGQWIATIGALLGALFAGAVALRNGTKANAPAESNAQLAWVKQAQDEATDARTEAREAKAESAAARLESEQTRQQQVRLRREFDAMQDWVERVIRARDAYVLDHGGNLDSLEDSAALRLVRAINGGPHLAP